MKARYNFEDVEDFISKGKAQVADMLEKIASEGEALNRASTGYHDVTGNLRASNWHTSSPDGIELGNSAPYASDVQRRGNVVADGITLVAARIREEFG